MSRSGYHQDLDPLDLGRWRAQVASATRGKRGQSLMRDMLSALDAMPEKRLITHELEKDGEVCALGAVGRYRRIDMADLDPEEPEDVAAAFDIAHQLAQEVVFINDEAYGYPESPEHRWKRIREWVSAQIRTE